MGSKDVFSYTAAPVYEKLFAVLEAREFARNSQILEDRRKGGKCHVNKSKIRRITQRIEKLKQMEQREGVDTVVNGVRIFENHEAGRLQLYFEGKPDEDIRKKLKSNGFRWSPSQGAWQRGIGNYALRAALDIAKSVSN